MRRVGLALALLVAAPLHAAHGEPLRKMIRNVVGEVGGQACKDYAVAEPRSPQASAVELWVDSYLSGYAVSSGIDILRGTDPQGRHAQLREFCKAEPEAPISDAAEALLYRLRRPAAFGGDIFVSYPTQADCSIYFAANRDTQIWLTGYLSGFATATGKSLWGDLGGAAIELRLAAACVEDHSLPLDLAGRRIYEVLAARP